MNMIPNTRQFRKIIWDYYTANKRAFAWRKTKEPYRILVSEVMLQQTQTDRVSKKYEEWLKAFPTVQALATAPFPAVLKVWQGLGYNRRALALKRAAETIVTNYKGRFPKTYEEILNLPGIGPYTAGAIMNFAFNKATPIIETNIRTVYIHHFFKDHGQVHDKELMPLIEKTMDTENPRQWFYALMDYGVMLKKTIGNASRQSRHYTKQSKFEGSNRQIRSTILKLVSEQPVNINKLGSLLKTKGITATMSQVEKNVTAMIKEGFMIEVKNSLHIAK